MYKFTVRDTEGIDFGRIVKEEWDDGNEISIIQFSGPSHPAVEGILAIHKDFLKKFVEGDNVEVAYECLSPIWGYVGVETSLKGGTCALNPSGTRAASDGRFRAFPISKLEEIKEQVNAAKEYRRRIQVTVTPV